MRRKRTACLLICLAAYILGSVTTHAFFKWSRSTPTMIVVPARYSVLQVAFDIVERHGTILVAYQGAADSDRPVLHAWNGREWVFVTLEDYAEANFIQILPEEVVLVGDDDNLPAVLESSSSWYQRTIRISSIDTATLINSFGEVLSFSKREWTWFSKRYNLDMVDLNAEDRSTSWYDQAGPKHEEYRSKYRVKDLFGGEKSDLRQSDGEALPSVSLRPPIEPIEEDVSSAPPFEPEVRSESAPRRSMRVDVPDASTPQAGRELPWKTTDALEGWQERAVSADVE